MIIQADAVFTAKKTYDQARKDFGTKKLPKTYESAVEIQRDKRMIGIAIEAALAGKIDATPLAVNT